MRTFFLVILLFILPVREVLGTDSTYYKKYNESVIFSTYFSQRNYNVTFNQRFYGEPAINTALDYQADANDVTGVELVYDKFGVAFGVKATPPNDITRKGKTQYSNFQFNFGGNKWRLETSYRRFKGFYENNSINYIQSFDSTRAFYQLPNFLNRSVGAKFFYFTKNKRFSYCSSYSCNYRQFRPSASWVLASGIHHTKLATDTSFIPDLLRTFYNRQAYLSGIKTFGYSLGAGFSVNLVLWKSFFYNLTVVISPELQLSKYNYYPNVPENYARLNLNTDIRTALGYNGKRFFCTLSSYNEILTYNYSKMDINTMFISAYFTIGFRVGVKPPKIYQKFQETKLYNMF